MRFDLWRPTPAIGQPPKQLGKMASGRPEESRRWCRAKCSCCTCKLGPQALGLDRCGFSCGDLLSTVAACARIQWSTPLRPVASRSRLLKGPGSCMCTTMHCAAIIHEVLPGFRLPGFFSAPVRKRRPSDMSADATLEY